MSALVSVDCKEPIKVGIDNYLSCEPEDSDIDLDTLTNIKHPDAPDGLPLKYVIIEKICKNKSVKQMLETNHLTNFNRGLNN